MTVWRELSEAAGKQIEPELADLRPGELQHSCLDIARAERELGWRPQAPIAEGLRLTYGALVEEFERDEAASRSAAGSRASGDHSIRGLRAARSRATAS